MITKLLNITQQSHHFCWKNIWYNLPLLASACIFAFMRGLLKLDLTVLGIVFILGLSLSGLHRCDRKWIECTSILTCSLTAAVVIWNSSRIFAEPGILYELGPVAQTLGMDELLISGIVAVVCGAGSCYCILYGFNVFYAALGVKHQTSESNHSAHYIVAAFLSALIVLGICSKSSPLYPLNDWVDSNCYLTVGKSMFHGIVPYRDLLEQKGPLLYMLHAGAALISDTSFIGVFLLEVLAGTWFLCLCWKIIALYEKNPSVLWLPVIATAVYTSIAFCHGDSAEEFCLPLIASGVYQGISLIQAQPSSGGGQNSSNSPHHGVTSFWIGVTSACVLWIKFSMLGFYLGWFAAIALIWLHDKRTKQLLTMILQIIAGVMAVSTPIVLYFGINSALQDLFQVYFYDNLFSYTVSEAEGGGAVNNFYGAIRHMIDTNFLGTCLFVLGCVFLGKDKRYKELALILLSWIGLVILVYGGGRRYTYYSLILSSYGAIGIPALGRLSELFSAFLRKKGLHHWATAVLLLGCCFLSYKESGNTYLLSYSKADMPQYQFAKIIQTKENPTLLNYGFLDGGFYTAADVIPTCKAFCKLNIPLPEIMESQNYFVNEGLVDFVVTRGKELDSARYKIVATAVFPFEGHTFTYYLYQLDSV